MINHLIRELVCGFAWHHSVPCLSGIWVGITTSIQIVTTEIIWLVNYGRGVHILRAATQVWNCSPLCFLENLLRAKSSVNTLLTSILGEKQHHTFPTPKRKTGEVNEVELRQRERPKCTVVLVLNLEYKTGAALNGMGVQHLYNVWGWLASPWGWVGGGGALDQNKDIDIVPRPCPGS